MIKEEIIIQNLKCGGCANTIIKKLNAIDNVRGVVVDVENSQVSFMASDSKVIPIVKDRLKSLGYPVLDDENSVLSKAKSFVSCAKGRVS